MLEKFPRSVNESEVADPWSQSIKSTLRLPNQRGRQVLNVVTIINDLGEYERR